MILKKSCMLGLVTLLLSSPVLASDLSVMAQPTLLTINNTNEDSSVFIINTGKCAPRYTKKLDTLTTPLGDARVICHKLSGFCDATMFATKDCSGNPTATLQLDLSNAHATLVNSLDSKYVISITNNDAGSIVTMNYATQK